MGQTHHPDEHMQGMMMAYKMAFRDKVDIITTWEWMKDYCLRNTFYPFILSIPLHLLRIINLDYNFLVVYSPLFFNTLIVVLGDYYSFLFVTKLLNKKCSIIFIIYSLFN
jgi:hypothetical protein